MDCEEEPRESRLDLFVYIIYNKYIEVVKKTSNKLNKKTQKHNMDKRRKRNEQIISGTVPGLLDADS